LRLSFSIFTHPFNSPSLIELERGNGGKKEVLVSPFSFSKEKGWG